MDHTTRAELIARAAEKRALHTKIKSLDQNLGRLAQHILDEEEYTSKSEIARMLGISHTAVSNLLAGIEDRPTPEHIAILRYNEAGPYVRDQGARIVRSVSSFDDTDAWAYTLLDPRWIYDEDGEGQLPHVYWLLDTGEWVGVIHATVGYGGTGCRYTQQALEAAGVDKGTAAEIVSWRFCDAVDISDRATWMTSKRWPVSGLFTPAVTNGYLVARVGAALRALDPTYRPERPRREGPVDDTGFLPSVVDTPSVQAWIQLLDSDDPPAWARGSRRFRVFLSSEEAARTGFITHGWTWMSRPAPFACPQVVIEQGDLQLWLHLHDPDDDYRLLPAEAYSVLQLAGIDTSELEAEDERRGTLASRATRALLGTDKNLASSFDLGEGPLQHLPTQSS